MKLFSHPIHIMLIHFPSALFPMDLVCSAIAFCLGMKSFYDAAFYALIGGVVFGWAAVITGTFDLLAVFKNKPASVKAALIHGGINTVVLMAFSVIAFIEFQKYPEHSMNGLPLIIIKAGLVLVMIVGNYLGGNLILKDKVLEKK